VKQQNAYRRHNSVTPTSTTTRIVRDARATFAEETRNMRMAVQTHRWTRRDLERLPDDGNTYEVVRGALFVTPAPGRPHQEIVAALADRLVPYVAAHALGVIHFPRSVIVIDDSEIEPDLMVRPRVPPGLRWEDAPLPFLIVEVLSDTTRRRDLVAKRSFYMEEGVAEYWIVDGKGRTITIVRPDQPDEVVTAGLRWHPSNAPAALDFDVATMFRDALG
jgi:Uma2 family endonuclease